MEVDGADEPRGDEDGVGTWRRLCGGCGRRLVPIALVKLRELHVPLCELGTGPESNRYPDMRGSFSHWHVACDAIRQIYSYMLFL